MQSKPNPIENVVDARYTRQSIGESTSVSKTNPPKQNPNQNM